MVMVYVVQVLEHWKAGGHKALLFTQTQQMLDIMERCVQSAGMAYHRMDGSTNVAARARLVDDFNDNPGIFVFLLTTKVGGVGINLAAANRWGSTWLLQTGNFVAGALCSVQLFLDCHTESSVESLPRQPEKMEAICMKVQVQAA